MKNLSARAASRFVCVAGSLLSLTLLTGITLAPQAHARLSSGQVTATLTSVSAPTHFTSGSTIPVEIGVSGGSTQVQITSRPAGIVNYTGTATNGTTLSVPTTAIDTNGAPLSVTLVVKTDTQTLEVASETDGDLEPIFPAPSSTTPGDLEPIFPGPRATTTATPGDLEPIFPKPSTATATPGDLEPIFPSPRATAGDLEPIFPRPTAGDLEPIFPAPKTTPGDLEPIFPAPRLAAFASRLQRHIVTVRATRAL